MSIVKLSYGNEGFTEIKAFLESNFREGYSLSIYDDSSQGTVEIICQFNDMVDAIMCVSSIEHDFPCWIGINDLTDSYVVGMNLTSGRIHVHSVYRYKNGNLNRED